MAVWVFYRACDWCGRHYRVSCNVQPQMKPSHATTISDLLNSKIRLMTLMLKHVLPDVKWCHRGLLKACLFKSNWMYCASTHSITQKYHQRCFHSLTSTRINGALTRVLCPERELANLGALLDFWANAHAFGMMTSPKWDDKQLGQRKNVFHWMQQNGQGFFLHWGKNGKIFFYCNQHTQPVNSISTQIG